jgi:hypothetical protein
MIRTIPLTIRNNKGFGINLDLHREIKLLNQFIGCEKVHAIPKRGSSTLVHFLASRIMSIPTFQRHVDKAYGRAVSDLILGLITMYMIYKRLASLAWAFSISCQGTNFSIATRQYGCVRFRHLNWAARPSGVRSG